MSEMYVERSRRGIFGYLFLTLFWIFNIIMAAWLLSYWVTLGGDMAEIGGEAEQAGYAIGATIGTGLLLVVWACGAVILGLFALLTRGRKEMIRKY